VLAPCVSASKRQPETRRSSSRGSCLSSIAGCSSCNSCSSPYSFEDARSLTEILIHPAMPLPIRANDRNRFENRVVVYEQCCVVLNIETLSDTAGDWHQMRLKGRAEDQPCDDAVQGKAACRRLPVPRDDALLAFAGPIRAHVGARSVARDRQDRCAPSITHPRCKGQNEPGLRSDTLFAGLVTGKHDCQVRPRAPHPRLGELWEPCSRYEQRLHRYDVVTRL
jgi:hypothetical protein